MRRTLLIFCVGLFIFSCARKHNPVSPEKGNFPPAPSNLIITVGDKEISLSWDMEDTTDIYKYNIFRKDSVDAEMSLIDSSFTRRYTDTGLKNGNEYFYQVSAVNNEGYEGPRSTVVSAVPNVFDVLIENGKEYTNTRSVTLTLTAPQGTAFMKVSNDSTFADARWEPFASVKSWTLSPGDGIKTVYVKFRDARGNETLSPARDSIILDTKATITAVTEDTGGQSKSPGDVIHFTVVTGEPDGEATVDIGTAQQGIILYDDGTNGDNNPDDGTYEVDFTVPRGLEVRDAIVTGHFTDRVGNVAPPVKATGKVTIQQPPSPVTLFSPTPIGTSLTSLNISWSKNTDTDFDCYKLFRSKTPGVDSTSSLVTTITSQSTTSYDDTGLQENTTYYYRVYVYDKGGLAAGSNEVSGKTNANEPPTAVTLYDPIAPSGTTHVLRICWSQNNDDDFASYKLYRSENDVVNLSSTLVTTINDRTKICYEDSSLHENTTYWYRVYVFDDRGLSTGSNTVSGTTNANQPPTPVTLYPPSPKGGSTSILSISWSQNTDEDFACYKLFRSKTPGVDSTSVLVTTITSQQTTTYDDTYLQANTTYYYRIYVYDTGGLAAGSNEVSGRTNVNEPPTAVTLFAPSSPTYSSLTLSWTQNQDEDFASYRVFRSESPGVDSTSTLVTTITERTTVTYTDTDLKENTTYYYRVYVYDTGGLCTGSNEVNATTTINEPPTAVTLFAPSNPTQSSLYLSWTQNNDEDFASYRLFRSKSPGVDNSSQFVTIIVDRTVIYFTDTGLEENTTYYYRLYVYDTGGRATGSNEVNGTTLPNQPPTPVTLSLPSVIDSTTLRLSWSQNEDEDFASYRIFRSQSSPVDTTAGPVAIINSQTTTQYDDRGLVPGTQYFYRVFVFDKGGLSAGSNEVSGRPQ